MKRVLFLDDDARRTHEVSMHLEKLGCDYITVETVEGCTASLASGAFDLVLLDHDLGGEVFCDSNRADCGMEVVRWLKANGGEHRGIIVHTMNSVAAAAMYMELHAMGYTVRQAQFGSREFYDSLYHMLGSRRKVKRKTIGERINSYLRSIRGS